MNTLTSPTRNARAAFIPLIGALACALLLTPAALWAGSSTWLGGDGDWNVTANWEGGVLPGTFSGSNTDKASFETGSGVITIDNGRNLGQFLFDKGVGSYTFNGTQLVLANGGNLSLLSTMTGSGVVETFNAPIRFQGGGASFTNDRADATSKLVINGDLTTNSGATTTLTLNGAGTGANVINGNLTLSTGPGFSITYAATAGSWELAGANNVMGTGAISVQNTGTLILSGAFDYSGGLTLRGNGTVVLNSDTALGSGTLTLGNSSVGGTLVVAGANRSYANKVSIQAAVTVSGTQNLSLTGDFTQTGAPRTLTNNLSAGKTLTLGNVFLSENTTARTLTINGSGNTVIEGVVSNGTAAGVAAGGLTLSTTGTTTLKGANTFTGNLSVNNGTLFSTAANNFADNSKVAINTGATLVFGVGGAGAWTEAQIDTLRAANVFKGSNTIGFDTTGGDFSYGSAIGSGFGLLKTGENTLTLSGAQTARSVKLDGGSLDVAGSLTAAGGLNVTRFSGLRGAVNGGVTVAAGAGVAPGILEGDLGSFSATSLTFADDSSFLQLRLDSASADGLGTGAPVAGTDYDSIALTGLATLNGAELRLSLGAGFLASLAVDGLTGDLLDDGNLFYILTAGGDASGRFSFDGALLNEGDSFTVDDVTFKIYYGADHLAGDVTGGHDIALQAVAVVPEPGTWALLLGGLGMLGLWRRRGGRA